MKKINKIKNKKGKRASCVQRRIIYYQVNRKGLQSFEAKINCYFNDQSKKTESSNDDINCFEKHWVTHELQGTDMSSTNKRAGTYNSKNGAFS